MLVNGAPSCPVTELSNAEAHLELQRILASETFVRFERQSRFLRFLVERTLQAQTDTLKEYVLGVEVFSRQPSFDPRTDPIVRVEASKLRRRLEQYYETEGRDHPVAIELPKRTYVPLFRHRQPAALSVLGIRTWPRSPNILKAGMAIMIVLLAAVGAYREATRNAGKAYPSLAEAPSIVVLPFADLSPNKDQEYLCDGLTEELIEALTKLDGLRVISRTSSFHFKGKMEDIRKIGAEANVTMVLEGSVRRSENRLRVIAQLVDATDGHRLWSSTYDREMKAVLAIPEEVASAIAATLQVELARLHKARLPTRYSQNPQATDLYLKGLHFARHWRESDLRKGIDYLERAIREDPNHAAAYARLAECYSMLGVHGAFPASEVGPKAKAAAAKALALNDSVAEAHVSLGIVKAAYDWDWAGAEREFQRALQLDPLDADVHEAYVMAYLAPRGRLLEALREVKLAHTLDPVSPGVHTTLGMGYYFMRQNDRAIEQYREALEIGPRFSAAHVALGLAYEQKAMFEDAVAAFQEGKAAWTSGMGESLLGHAYARMGKRREAQAVLGDLQQLSARKYVSGAYLAVIYLGLGDRDRAMEWLEKAYEQRSASLVFLKVDPRWDSLLSDPRFVSVLKRIGLE